MGRREELGARIREAVDRHSNNGSFNVMAQAFFGMDVAAYEGVNPYPASIVEAWMYGTVLPTFGTLGAIAKAAGFAETKTGLPWLIFGSDYSRFAAVESEFQRYYGDEGLRGELARPA